MTNQANISKFVFGKVPPQAVELEQVVLGAVMQYREALTIAAGELVQQDFYDQRNGNIFQSALELYELNQPVDQLTVMERLKKNGLLDQSGGVIYLSELTNRVASAANQEYHCRLIKQKAIARKLIAFGSELIRESYQESTDVIDLIGKAEESIFNISVRNSGSISGMSQVMSKVVARMQEAQQSKDGITGVPTGYADIDRLFGGLQPQKTYIIAARPGMGKTALVLGMAKNAAEFGRSGAFFSLEMGDVELGTRLVCAEAGINGEKVNTGTLDESEQQQFMAAAERLSDLGIYIDDTPGVSIMEMRSKARLLKAKNDIQYIMVDYIQLMEGDEKHGNREQEVSKISRALKGIAKELNVPVIELAQLSRAVETRGGTKRPQLSDLRESGSIEQDADVVAFLYRPEYYQILEDEEGKSLKGICEFIVAKNRSGRLTTVKLKFNPENAKFSDINDPGDFPTADDDPWNSTKIQPAKRNDDEDIPF